MRYGLPSMGSKNAIAAAERGGARYLREDDQ